MTFFMKKKIFFKRKWSLIFSHEDYNQWLHIFAAYIDKWNVISKTKWPAG